MGDLRLWILKEAKENGHRGGKSARVCFPGQVSAGNVAEVFGKTGPIEISLFVRTRVSLYPAIGF